MNAREAVCRQGYQPFDFALLPYGCVDDPTGGLAPVRLLVALFEASAASMQAQTNGVRLVDGLRAELGSDRTVWGSKWNRGALEWEIYFYRTFDYQGVAIGRVARVLRPFLTMDFDVSLAEKAGDKCSMFSFDLDHSLTRATACNLYYTEAAMQRSGREGERLDVLTRLCDANGSNRTMIYRGRTFQSFILKGDSLQYGNHYECTWNEQSRLRAWQAKNPFMRSDAGSLPEFPEAAALFLALKREAAGLYYCRVNVDSLVAFLERYEWPSSFRRFVGNEASRLQHLLFDVGVDYLNTESGLRTVKCGLWGTL